MARRSEADWLVVDRLASSAARGGLMTAAGTWGRFVLQFGTVVVVARLLGPSEYGFAAIVLVFSAVSELIRNSGLASALLQRKDVTVAIASSLHYVSLGIGLALGVTVMLVVPLLSSLLGDHRFEEFSPMFAIILLAAGVATVPTALLTRNLAFGAVAVAELIAVVVSCIAAIVLVWQALIFACIVAVGTLVACPWRPGRVAQRSAVAPYLHFGANAAVVQLLRYASQSADRIALSITAGPIATGLYSQANQLIMLPVAQVSRPLQRIVLPVLSRLSDEPDRYRRYYGNIVGLVAYALWPAFFALYFLADSLIEVLFGSEWSGSVPIFQVLVIAGVANTLIYVNSWVFVSTGNVRSQSILMAITAPVTTVSILFGVLGGALGVAMAIAISSVISVVPGFIVSKWRAPISTSDFLGPLLWPSVVSGIVGVVTAVAVALAPPASLITLLVGGASALIAYAASVIALPPARRSIRVILSHLRPPIENRLATH